LLTTLNTHAGITIPTNPDSWSKLGLGTGTLASLGRAATLSTVNLLLNGMAECGANVIDTADSYGSGDCEILLGKALSGRRTSFKLVTKAGYRLSNLGGPLRPLNQFIKKGLHRLGHGRDFRPAYLAKCLDDSLQRLRTERVDAFLLHDIPLEAVTDPEIHELCRRLKQSGKTARVGLSSDNHQIIRAAIGAGVFDVIQTPANLLAAMDLQLVWEECDVHGIQVVGNHVFSPATLAQPGMSRETIMRACAALMPASATILCGTRNQSHFTETFQWASDPLSHEEARALASECLRLSQAPTA
jgi:pyridoxine 4-dehydrogenase